MKKLLILFIVGLPVIAADSNSPAAAPRQISAELRAKFWRVIAEQESAKAAADRAVQSAKAVEAEMRQECGDLQVVMNASGEPACAAKPESPKSPK